MTAELKIKICGLREIQNIHEVAALKPDFMGFIFYPGSKRYAGDHFNPDVKIPEEINRVGVFVNEDISNLLVRVNHLGINYVQLHGDESAAYCKELHDMNIHVIKAFGIDENFDFAQLDDFESTCDLFLFDNKTRQYGGSGKKFNREILKKYKKSHPFILSGGVSIEDTDEINRIRKEFPVYGVDLNSRFEKEPGIKDINLLKGFINKIK